MAALANEKGRQESELRQRRLRRRTSSPSDDVAMDSNNDGGNRSSGQATNDEGVDLDRKKKGSPQRKTDGHDGHGEATSSKSASSGSSEASSREMLEAAARASLLWLPPAAAHRCLRAPTPTGCTKRSRRPRDSRCKPAASPLVTLWRQSRAF